MWVRKLMVAALALALVAAFAACGSSDKSSSGSSGASTTDTSDGGSSGSADKPLAGKTIWYVGVLDANPGEFAIAQGINKAVTDAGGTMIRSTALNATTGSFDIGAHTQGFVRAIAAKPAAIIYFSLTPEEMGPQVKQARAAGIPVFALAGEPDKSIPVNAWTDFDSVGQGKLVADYMSDNLPEGAKVTVIAGRAGIPVVEKEMQSAMAAFAAKGMTFVGDEDQQRNDIDNAAGGQKVMASILQRVPDVQAVFAYNDDSVLGAISAAKAAHKTPGKDIMFGSRNGGNDAIAAIKAGDLMVTCDIDPIGFGANIAQAAIDTVTGKQEYDNAQEITPPDSSGCLVNKDNVDQYQNWTDRIPYAKLTEK